MTEPTSITLPFTSPRAILAVGAELKNTPALLRDNVVTLLEATGHLDDPNARRAFLKTLDQAVAQLPADGVIACDAHPTYASSRHARGLGRPVIEVQHHHAHITAAMAEHGLAGPVVGLAADGTGWGPDGTIWGCEVLLADLHDYRRAGHLRTFALPGGDRAAVETCRPAASILQEAFGDDWPEVARPRFATLDPPALAMLRHQIHAPQTRRTSSLGRLFDAAAFLTGLCDRNDTEAAAPIALQQAAEQVAEADPLDYTLIESDGVVIMDPLAGMAALADTARPVAERARAFHEMLAAMLAETLTRVARRESLEQVVLSGGCFFNRLLGGRLVERLDRAGLGVYTHQTLSPGDDGLAVGQACTAAARLMKKGLT